MIKFLKFVLLMIVFFAFLIIFSPKEKLFNFALLNLQKEKITLNSYTFKDKLFTFNIKNSNLIYDSIETAKINNINFSTYILYNSLDIKNININDSFSQFVPSKIKNLKIVYSILNPLYVDINLHSKEFKVDGYFDILKQKVFLKFNMSKIFKKKYSKLLRELKYNIKTKDYTYEYKL